ncbi:hypothetical protein KAW18_03185 [candidate division WOR-3 bacterium]|nr:hypothetical protein [candidate division WOR-3 bacterium]
MKKILLISVLLLLMLANCSEQVDDPLGPYPGDTEGILQQFIEKGWESYNNGDYDIAYARFDSAVKLDAGNADAYVGLGYSNMQLGSEDESRFDFALSSFGFVPTLEGGSPIFRVLDANIEWGYVTHDSALFGLGVVSSTIPVLGVLESEVHFIPGPSAPSNVEEQDLEVMRITDNTIVTTPTLDNSSNLYIPFPDDTFQLDYAYFDGELSHNLALAFAGCAQTAEIQGKSDPEQLLYAMIYAKAVLVEYNEDNPLRADTLLIPNYVDPSITTRNVRLLLAQSYFYYGYLYNCMWELWSLDSTLVDYFHPDSSYFERELQEKLEDLQ